MYPTAMLNSSSQSSWHQPEGSSDLVSQAVLMYSAIILKGKLKRALSFLTRRSIRLVDLGTVMSSMRMRNQHYAGLESVKIDSIKGSEGKVGDFDNAFNPVHERTRGRWLSVARARLAGEELPPVELIQVDQIYFVRDGHHRISVAKALGEKYVDAEVIKWEVQPPDLKKQLSFATPEIRLAGQCL
ncbi:MAG TPA: hypothetical protein VE136_10190 [Anaerolineales bacterium]|jgi:hypothetical protein|nr:hypothetical protein [Anaerolineales bacterium]